MSCSYRSVVLLTCCGVNIDLVLLFDAAACADERVQFGAALGSFQLVQEKLARMLANVQAMFLMCWRLSKLYEEVSKTSAVC